MPLYRALRTALHRGKGASQESRSATCGCATKLTLRAGAGRVRTLFFGDAKRARAGAPRMTPSPSSFENVDTAAEDVAIIAFTSGTTGTPKAAMHYHRDLLATLRHVRRTRPPAAARRRVLRKPAARVHVRTGRSVALPALGRRGHAAAGEGGPAKSCCARSSGSALRPSSPRRSLIVRCAGWSIATTSGRCVRASRPARRLPKAVWEAWHAKTGLEDPRRHRQHGNAAHLHRFARSRSSRRFDGPPRTRLRRRNPRRRRAAGAGRHRRAARREGPDGLQVLAGRAPEPLRAATAGTIPATRIDATRTDISGTLRAPTT